MHDEDIYRTVHLKFSDDEIAAIDVWQEAQGIRTRSEAIRQAVRRGMDASSGSNELGEKARPFLAPGAGKPPIDAIQQMVREEVARAMSEILKHKKTP